MSAWKNDFFFLKRNKRLQSFPTFWNRAMVNTTENARIYGQLFFFSFSEVVHQLWNNFAHFVHMEESKQINPMEKWPWMQGKHRLKSILSLLSWNTRKKYFGNGRGGYINITGKHFAWHAKPHVPTACKRERTQNSVRRCWHKSSRVFRGFWNDFTEIENCLKGQTLSIDDAFLWTAVIWS